MKEIINNLRVIKLGRTYHARLCAKQPLVNVRLECKRYVVSYDYKKTSFHTYSEALKYAKECEKKLLKPVPLYPDKCEKTSPTPVLIVPARSYPNLVKRGYMGNIHPQANSFVAKSVNVMTGEDTCRCFKSRELAEDFLRECTKKQIIWIQK